jgi:hypothetical protein
MCVCVRVVSVSLFESPEGIIEKRMADYIRGVLGASPQHHHIAHTQSLRCSTRTARPCDSLPVCLCVLTTPFPPHGTPQTRWT